MGKWYLDDNGGKRTKYSGKAKLLSEFFGGTARVEKSTVSTFDKQFNKNNTYTKKMYFQEHRAHFIVLAVLLCTVVLIGYYFLGIREYNITVNVNDGSGESIEFGSTFGKHLEIPFDKIKEGYHLIGFRTEDGEIWDVEKNRIFGDIVLEAAWEKNQYTVTFEYNNGKDDSSTTLYYEDKIEFPTDVKKDGFHMMGWYTESNEKWNATSDVVTSDVKLSAKWAADQLSITYNAGEGQCDTASQSAHYLDKLTMPASQLRGYTFRGWSTSSEGESVDFPVGKEIDRLPDLEDGQLELFAVYQINSYKIVCDEGDSTRTYYYTVEDTLVNIKTPSRKVEGKYYENADYNVVEGTYYIFDGWYMDSAYTTPYRSSVLANLEDIKIYAKWKTEVHNLQLDLNGGTLNVENINLYINDSSVTLPVLAKKDNYIFAGWYESDDGQGDFYKTTQLKNANGKILHAHWVDEQTYTKNITGTVAKRSNYVSRIRIDGNTNVKIEVPEELKDIQSTGHLRVKIKVKCSASLQYRSNKYDATATIYAGFDDGVRNQIGKLVATGGGWPAIRPEDPLNPNPYYGDEVYKNYSSQNTYVVDGDAIEFILAYIYVVEFEEYENWAGGTNAVNFECDLNTITYEFYVE